MKEPRRSGQQVSVVKKIVFSLVPLLLFVSFVEAFFRVVPWHKEVVRTRSGLVVPDKDLIWRLNPQALGPLATNDLGFRDAPYNPRADRKVLLLGDSVSWGDGVADMRMVYPYVLEQQLSKDENKTYEVINSGVPGYSTFQELRYLQTRGLELKPDLIVLQFCLNDVVERYSSLSEYGGDNVFLGIDTRQSAQGAFGWLLRHSRAFEAVTRLLVRLSRNQQEYQVMKLASDTLSPELKRAWDTVLSEVDGIREIAVKNGIPLLIVVTPYNFQLDQPRRTNQPQRILEKYAGEHGVPFVDLLPDFSTFHEMNPQVPLFNDENHFSIQGHSLAAAVLSRAIETLSAGSQEGRSHDR